MIGLLERLGDRLNPVLVKEVRQALRGNYFRFTFWATVSLATVLGVMLIVTEDGEGPDGRAFLGVMFGCLALATHALVPFFAFVAMGGEWEENTYDLLQLSDLKPRQIALGKILSSGVQAMLYYSAFGPFLVFAFLLQGVDLLAVGIMLGGSAVLALVLSTVAVAVSTLSTKRYLRMFLHACLAAVLAVATMLSMQAGSIMVAMPQQIRTGEFLAGLGVALLSLLWLGGMAYAVAVARLAHREENSSTAGRILTAVSVPYAVSGFLLVSGLVPGVRGDHGELMLFFFSLAFVVLFVASILFCSEPDRLGRRVRLEVPTGRGAALLSVPFLPGGSRGILFYLACSALLLGALVIARAAVGSPADDPLDRHVLAALVTVLYGLVYLGTPRLLQPRRRNVVTERVLVLVLAAGPALVPSFVGFFLGERWLRDAQHPGNPFHVLSDVVDGHVGPHVFVVGAVAAVVLLLNGAALVRAQAEVTRASEARRRRERKLEGEEAVAAGTAGVAEIADVAGTEKAGAPDDAAEAEHAAR